MANIKFSALADGSLPAFSDETPFVQTALSAAVNFTPPMLRVVKKADETVTSSTVLQDDDELLVALQINKTYGMMIEYYVTSPALADLKLAFSVPSGATGSRNNAGFNITPQAAGDITGVAPLATLGSLQVGLIIARIIMSTTAGNLQFQWAQNTSNAGNTILHQGSNMTVWEELP